MKQVLIVDDDPRLAELIAEFCRDAGFETRTVTDSAQAFQTAKTWRPHLITLDLEMPGMDGVEVLRLLQSDPATAKIPVVVISVVAKGALDQGLLRGARMVFEKPLSFHTLLGRLKELAAAAVPDPAAPPVFEAYSRSIL
jgi:CheY-like chemotaxis protein